jgi:hypothetical protein
MKLNELSIADLLALIEKYSKIINNYSTRYNLKDDPEWNDAWNKFEDLGLEYKRRINSIEWT